MPHQLWKRGVGGWGGRVGESQRQEARPPRKGQTFFQPRALYFFPLSAHKDPGDGHGPQGPRVGTGEGNGGGGWGEGGETLRLGPSSPLPQREARSAGKAAEGSLRARAGEGGTGWGRGKSHAPGREACRVGVRNRLKYPTRPQRGAGW